MQSSINQNAQDADVHSVTPSATATETKPHGQPVDEVRQWLEDFAAAVRAVDYEAGRRLFAPEVVGFGTVGARIEGLDALVASQWKHVWGVTTGFRLHMQELTMGVSGDLAWAAVPWSSLGRSDTGHPFERHGRATYILHRRDGRWLAVHSHHSRNPTSHEGCP